jgi:hypothetical protein
MGPLAKELLAFLKRLPHQANFSEFQIAKTAVDNARRPAGGSGAEIILLQQQNFAFRTRALPGNCDAVDPAADHNDMEPLTIQ